MKFFDSHTLLLYLVYPMLALGIYFLIISSICMFLAFKEESDKILSTIGRWISARSLVPETLLPQLAVSRLSLCEGLDSYFLMVK
jgi:hypothetical protein